MDNKFTVIRGKADIENANRVMRTIALHNCWQKQHLNAIQKAVSENKGKKIEDYPQKDLMKIALSGIKYINLVCEIRKENERMGTGYWQSLRETQAIFNLIDVIFTIIGYIKLKNLVITFPITKDFDGDKWGCKDYFYTMDVLSNMDWDKPIGRDNIADLLWDYQNDDLRNAYVEFTCAMSDIYRSQTGKGIAVQFCDDIGVPTYTINDENGIVRNDQTGEIVKIRKNNNLHLVK